MSINIPTPAPAIIGLISTLTIGPLALYFGFRRFLTKVGIDISGSYTITSSVSCHQGYVSSVRLENHKDRAATVFAIYLRIGFNYYLEIENFEKSPLILKAFETYHKNYDPIDFYSYGWKRKINLSKILTGEQVPKRIYLSTTQGRYRVRKPRRRWDPISDCLRNYSYGVIRPTRTTYKGHSYGGDALYLVETTFGEDGENVIAIHEGDDEIKRFRDFQLTHESLESKEKLEIFFKEMQAQGRVVFKTLVVHDLKDERAKIWDEPHEEIEPRPLNRFQVQVFGKFFTWRRPGVTAPQPPKCRGESANRRLVLQHNLIARYTADSGYAAEDR